MKASTSRALSALPSCLHQDGVHDGLQLLLQMHLLTDEGNHDPWQFALDWRTLREMGLNANVVRWLLTNGY